MHIEYIRENLFWLPIDSRWEISRLGDVKACKAIWIGNLCWIEKTKSVLNKFGSLFVRGNPGYQRKEEFQMTIYWGDSKFDEFGTNKFDSRLIGDH